MKILILCTGNSCRSQMAECILKSFDNNLDVLSAGTQPEIIVNPFAVKVMEEMGIDISINKTKNVNDFINQEFDYVITVCSSAKENCPVFTGKVKNRIHIGFEDPAAFKGNKFDTLNKYRQIRDEIFVKFKDFHNNLKK